MKKLACSILCFVFTGAFCLCSAATKSVSPQVYSGIANYKKANYTGCMQDMEAALKNNPNDILAKYYLALVYTKIGMQEEAKKYYEAVVNQGGKSEKILVSYSKKALVCLNDPTDKLCGVVADEEENKKEDKMSEFIRSGEFLHPDLKKSIEKRELKDVKDSFNADKFPDLQDYRFINDAKDEIPSDAQIAAAVKVLAKAGYNPMASAAASIYTNPYNAYSTQMAQMGMLNNTNANNNFVNMLPYLMAQQNNGNTVNPNLSPELIQTMLMNQAMPGFDLNN